MEREEGKRGVSIMRGSHARESRSASGAVGKIVAIVVLCKGRPHRNQLASPWGKGGMITLTY